MFKIVLCLSFIIVYLQKSIRRELQRINCKEVQVNEIENVISPPNKKCKPM